MKTLLMILSFLFITSLIVNGQVPQTTSFQGVLTDSEGSVLSDGTYSLNFKLFDSAADGTMLWEETQDVATVGGIFNVILGRSAALDLPFDEQYWLEITIDGGDALSPRVELIPSPYSLSTRSIPDSIVSSEKIENGNLVRSINTLKDSVTLAAGSNVVITERNNTITISSTGGGTGDNLGDHTATQNIKLNGKYLSGDGGNEGVFVTNDGKIGIGTSAPNSLLQIGTIGSTNFSVSTSGSNGGFWASATNTGDVTNYGGYFGAAGTTGRGVQGSASGADGRGVYGSASGVNGQGVYGWASSSGTVTNYGGYFKADGASGRGVYGITGGITGVGVQGYAGGVNGQGVRGWATNTGDVTNYGGYFGANGTNGSGVFGSTLGTNGRGVYGRASGTAGRGVYGTASNGGDVTNYGGYFTASGKQGRGVYGYASGTLGYGVHGVASNTSTWIKYGGYFIAYGPKGRGVCGIADSPDGIGVQGRALGTGGIGISGTSTSGYAGYFYGDVQVTGTLSKGGGSFKIDHPLDPQNKNLYHSFVESPDMKNIYDGNVTTDGNGNATVKLPEWFEALNKDFRYQLTVIGEFAQAIISQKIKDNRFSIKTDKSNVEVSWLVTGIRKDAFANANRIPVEEMKKPEERGKYLHPKAFGVSETMGVDYDEELKEERIRMEQEHLEMEKIRKEEEQRLEEERTRMEQEEAERMRIEENQLKIKND